MEFNEGPKHIAIILDGNRRYAQEQGITVYGGHAAGAEKVQELLDWCHELGIEQLTLYVLSTENLKRSGSELENFHNLFGVWYEQIKDDERIDKYGVRINFIGNPNLLPESSRDEIKRQIKDLEDKTKQYGDHILNFAFCYGGRQELCRAVKCIAAECLQGGTSLDDITEDFVGQHLYMSDEPDMVIRTGGRQRTSNFLIWQSAYSELYFTRKLWPDFAKADLVTCINDFKYRQRNFGK